MWSARSDLLRPSPRTPLPRRVESRIQLLQRVQYQVEARRFFIRSSPCPGLLRPSKADTVLVGTKMNILLRDQLPLGVGPGTGDPFGTRDLRQGQQRGDYPAVS